MRKTLLLTLFFSFLLCSTVFPASKDRMEAEGSALQVHFLGITEGESSLIQFSNGYTVLIDAGSHNSGKEVATELLDRKVTRIDTLILTGEKDGHIGGTEELLKQFPIERIVLPGPLKDVIYHKLKIPSAVKLVTAVKGQSISLPLNGVIKVLHPGNSLSLSPQGNSFVLQFNYQKINFLFTSDINHQVEEQLVEKFNVESQILKVSDSGSNQASGYTFLKKVDPHAAIIFQDGAVHRSTEVIARLRETWVDVYETNKFGTVTIVSDGIRYHIKKENPKGYFNGGKDQ